MRWFAFAGAGAIVGAITFFWMVNVDVAFAPIYVASGALAAGFETALARRAAASTPTSTLRVAARALSAFALVTGTALAVFALLYTARVAP